MAGIKAPERYSVVVEQADGTHGDWEPAGEFEIEHKHLREDLAEQVFQLDIKFASSIVKKNTFKRQLAVWNERNLKDVDFQKTKSITAEYEFREDGRLRVTVNRL